MRFLNTLPFAALASAIVLPEDYLRGVEIEDYRPCWDKVLAEKDYLVESVKDTFEEWRDDAAETTSKVWTDVKQSFDATFDAASDEAEALKEDFFGTEAEAESWLSTKVNDVSDFISSAVDHKDPHHQPNLTVYQLIASSKYTTKLAALINEFDDLVKALNSTKGNFTVFAPTDDALDKIPKHAPKPSKKQLKEFLSYHVVPELYSAKRVLFANTAPTLLKSDSLGSEPLPQRLAFRLRLKGLTVNFYSRVIAANVFGTNGVVHGVDTPIFPPIGAIREIDLFPGAFSTLELGLLKTGLLEKLNTTDHQGGTLFAPNNGAFERLGPKLNAFLFSEYGRKYLKALLEYHIVPENTLYSDAYYKADPESVDTASGKVHVELPTALKDRTLSIDIARYGPLIFMNVNGFNRVAVTDVVAEDGVIHVMSEVIIPPKQPGGSDERHDGMMTVEEFKERLEPYVTETPKSDL